MTVFSYTTFSLQVQQIDINTFNGQTFIVSLGSFERATNSSEPINPENLLTFNAVLNSTETSRLTDSTASIQLPSSLSNELLTCFNMTGSNSFQRLSYSVFLSDSLFLPRSRSQFRVGSIILSPRFQCALEDLSVPIQTTFSTIPEVKFVIVNDIVLI